MQLLNHISTQSQGTLTLERVENIGGHYAKTLRLWRESFLLNFDEKISPALLESHPGMSKSDIAVFRKKWEVRIADTVARSKSRFVADSLSYKYYFAYCEAGFSTKTLGDVIITVGRAGALELMDGIPL